ncbi:MAG TPA: carboxypeptidase regulatory-like domain-containing protein [Solirubrobacteraceae bacterium]|nr:carboxypeptidase regulatory-like domain-containing protein [Solirubrobacteraceae bacterium]
MEQSQRQAQVLARAKPQRRKGGARGALALLLACVSLGSALIAIAPTDALAAETGAISGAVTAADTKAPLAEISVCVLAFGGLSPGQCQTTGTNGEYEVAGLAAGQYEVEFSPPEDSGLNYLTQFYEGSASRADAKAVTVTEGTVTTAIDAAMVSGGRVKGLVSGVEGKPLAASSVCALDAATGSPVRCSSTDQAGEYVLQKLATGEYEIEFSPPSGSELSYVKQYFNGAATRAFATPLSVTAGAPDATEANATLQLGGNISGTVTSAATKGPVGGVLVCAADSGIGIERCATTAPDGTYTVALLPPGSYRVHFDPSGAGTSYASQFYKEAETEGGAQLIAVAAGSSNPGIDAVLQGVPVALLKPAITGRAIEGQALTMVRGTWTNAPASVTDEWGRCDGTGMIESCHTVATGPVYTLTAADVGHTIRIREKASNLFGEGAPLFSPPTAVVVAAPRPQPVAVLSSVARTPTTAQLRALLASLLTPRGRNASIGALLKHRGYAVSFRSLSAGTLSIAWYQLPKGAHLSATKPKPVLVAKGSVATTAGGSVKLKIRLTKKGRSVLSRSAKRVTLTARGVLAPSGRGKLSATRAFKLKR